MSQISNNKQRRNKRKQSRRTAPSGSYLSTRTMMRNDPIYTVTKRVVGLAVCVSSTTVETFTANGITLNSIPGYATLTAAFDQYRFDMVEFEYLPRVTISDGVLANPGVFASVVDRDDASTVSTFNEVLEYPSAQIWTQAPGKTNLLKHRFVPMCAIAAYAGAFTSYATKAKQWIDCGSPAVAHYGVKSAWTPTASVFTMDLVITATISFRASR